MVTAITVLVVGALAEATGIHAFLGAFLGGIPFAGSSGASNPEGDGVQQCVVGFFAPI